MNQFEFQAITGLLLAVLIGTMGAVPALAGPNGTTSGETTANAIAPAGGTLPLSPGELSVRWDSADGSDSVYADTQSNVVTSVDTGFDMTWLDTSPANTSDTIAPGDSTVYSFEVTNLGNNGQPVPFTFDIVDTNGSTSKFTWQLYHDSNNNGSFDTGTDDTADTDVMFAENETDTIFVVVNSDSSAGNGDTLGQDFFATDNAPIAGEGSNIDTFAGDQWEDSGVISDTDNRDTQTAFLQTFISGPELQISKEIDTSILAASPDKPSYRPGDTVGYRITVRNVGGDTADNVEVVDAIPDKTTLKASNGMNWSNPGSIPNLGPPALDDDLDPPFEDDAGTLEQTKRIKWDIPYLGPEGQSNDFVEVTFRVTID